MLTALSLLVTSCGGKEPQQKHLEYENAVATFVSAFNKNDEQSLLSCFTPAAKESFMLTEESAISLLDENISDACGEYVALSYKLGNKTELTQEEIDSIKSAYNSEYGMRLNIKKAYSLDVTFYVTGVTSKTEKEMTVITAKTDSGWCICGEVITAIF